MDDDFNNIIQQLQQLYILRYVLLNERVNKIIKENIRDVKYIESTFDELLGFLFDTRLRVLFLKLYKYYLKVNKEYANEYLKFYEEEIKEYKKDMKN